MSRDAKPPAVPEIPQVHAVPRRYVRGPALNTLSLSLRTITPVLGGGAVTRRVEGEGKVRVPGIRGQLRFWWRALHAHEHDEPADLARREAELWGGMGRGGEQPRRSLVDLWVEGAKGELDRSPIGTKKLYGMWPARAQSQGVPEAERLAPGLQFRLCVRAPRDRMEDVQRTLRAWLLFGGIGGRTRRGLGSLTVINEGRDQWLPIKPTPAELRRLLGPDISFAGDRAWEEASDTPSLHGARLHCGKPMPSDEAAWLQALGWLSEFRQGPPKPNRIPDPNLPREPPPARDPDCPDSKSADRPGRSKWPEPDKVRLLSGRHIVWAHSIRHPSESIVWPRASFGLPIVGRFQRNDRCERPYDKREPPDYELRWRFEKDDKPRDRLASPLIVKAMGLADGQNVPVALWLFRGYPANGKVVLCRRSRQTPGGIYEERGSAAPFDVLHAEGDPVLYEPLRQRSVREAFFTWLTRTKGIRSIEP
jgi:CRISPR-associated protein Cmr1